MDVSQAAPAVLAKIYAQLPENLQDVLHFEAVDLSLGLDSTWRDRNLHEKPIPSRIQKKNPKIK